MKVDGVRLQSRPDGSLVVSLIIQNRVVEVIREYGKLAEGVTVDHMVLRDGIFRDSGSPLWPNPAPTGPIALINRIPGDSSGRAGSSIYHLGDSDITITVIDGEPLTDILNRVYALGRLTGQHDAFLENLEQRANQIILGK